MGLADRTGRGRVIPDCIGPHPWTNGLRVVLQPVLACGNLPWMKQPGCSTRNTYARLRTSTSGAEISW